MRAAVAPWKLLCLTCIYSASSVGRAFDKPANLISYARAAKDMWKFENVIVVGRVKKTKCRVYSSMFTADFVCIMQGSLH